MAFQLCYIPYPLRNISGRLIQRQTCSRGGLLTVLDVGLEKAETAALPSANINAAKAAFGKILSFFTPDSDRSGSYSK